MHALTSCCFFNLLTDILICAMYIIIARATSVLIFTFTTSLINYYNIDIICYANLPMTLNKHLIY